VRSLSRRPPQPQEHQFEADEQEGYGCNRSRQRYTGKQLRCHHEDWKSLEEFQGGSIVESTSITIFFSLGLNRQVFIVRNSKTSKRTC
jgi:hypothetical protein